jgi:hypothetical protein
MVGKYMPRADLCKRTRSSLILLHLVTIQKQRANLMYLLQEWHLKSNTQIPPTVQLTEVPSHWLEDGPIESAASTDFVASIGYIRDQETWHPKVVCFDTLSMINMFHEAGVPDPLPDTWRWLSRGGTAVGAGNKRSSTKCMLSIPDFKYSLHGRSYPLTVTVLQIPRGVHLVIGACCIMGTKRKINDKRIDLPTFRVYAVTSGKVIRLD